MDDAEVLTDTEEGDDNGELDIVEDFNSGDLAMSSTANSEAGKGIRARLLRFKQTDCEKKRGHGKGKKMEEGKCHTLHKKHFQSYQFSVGEKKGKKKDKDDESDYDDDDSSSTACRIIVYHDGKCKDEASTANEGSCEDMVDADDDDDEEKLHSRDLMGKPKDGKYKSARFLCDGVDVSSNSSSTKSVSDYYSSPSTNYPATSSYNSPYYSATSDHSSASPLSSENNWIANATGSSSKSFTPLSVNVTLSSRTRSGEPTSTVTPDEDDKEDPEGDDKDYLDDDKKEPDEKDDQEDEVVEADNKANLPGSQGTKTRKQHRSKSHKKTKGNKKHPKETQSTGTATQPAETITST